MHDRNFSFSLSAGGNFFDRDREFVCGGSAGIRTDESVPERENYIFMMTMQQMRNIMYVFAVFLQISTFYVRKSG